MDLSIVIVSWNTKDLLAQCLASLFRHVQGLAWEVVVVDNASQDGSPGMVRGDFPQVRLLENQGNPGFAVAVNRGIEASSGRYLLLLNSDTLLETNAPLGLFRFMEAHPQAGAAGCLLLQEDGTPQPYAYGRDPTLGHLIARTLRRPFSRGTHPPEWPQEVDWASAAYLILRRSALDLVGLMDEGMFMYFEDVDLCLRLRQAGWTVWLLPYLSVIHLGGGASLVGPQRRDYYYASLRHFYRKHYGWFQEPILSLLLLAYRHEAVLG